MLAGSVVRFVARLPDGLLDGTSLPVAGGRFRTPRGDTRACEGDRPFVPFPLDRRGRAGGCPSGLRSGLDGRLPVVLGPGLLEDGFGRGVRALDVAGRGSDPVALSDTERLPDVV